MQQHLSSKKQKTKRRKSEVASPELWTIMSKSLKKQMQKATVPRLVIGNILLMDKILHQLIGSLSHYSQGFLHTRRCRISSINSILVVATHFLMFTPIFGEMIQFDSYFSDGLKPPTRIWFLYYQIVFLPYESVAMEVWRGCWGKFSFMVSYVICFQYLRGMVPTILFVHPIILRPRTLIFDKKNLQVKHTDMVPEMRGEVLESIASA